MKRTRRADRGGLEPKESRLLPVLLLELRLRKRDLVAGVLLDLLTDEFADGRDCCWFCDMIGL